MLPPELQARCEAGCLETGGCSISGCGHGSIAGGMLLIEPDGVVPLCLGHLQMFVAWRDQREWQMAELEARADRLGAREP